MILTLLACGTVSNGPFTADAAYLDALPSEANHAVHFKSEADAETLPSDPPRLLQLSTQVSDQCNTFIFGLLKAVDGVRSLPPSLRTDDRREWGPYAYQPDLEVGAWMQRNGDSNFDWSFQGTPTGQTSLPFMSGSHYAGVSVAEGDGAFTWDQSLVSQWTGGTMAGTLTVDYDNRSGTDLLVDIADYSVGGSSPYDARYRYVVKDGVGDFQYRTVADVGWNDDPSTVEVRTRWVEGEGGRSDAKVTGATGRIFTWSQCWDATKALVYQEDTGGLNPDVGAESACLYPEAAVVDGL
jgi:hypothetical protein